MKSEALHPDLARIVRRQSWMTRLLSWVMKGPVAKRKHTFEGETFLDHFCDLSGRHVRDCHFDGCVIVLNFGPVSSVARSTFNNCRFYGDLAVTLYLALRYNGQVS